MQIPTFFKIALLTFYSFLFALALPQYPGSSLIYSFFSFVFLIMLLSGFYNQIAYGYHFLVVMLWLGFWFKFTIHLIFQVPFVEPIGRFISIAEKWDEALIVSSVAAIGILLSRVVSALYFRNISKSGRQQPTPVPVFYKTYSTIIWPIFLIVILIVTALNLIFGFQQSGLVPRTILGWHLNGMIYYLMAVIFSMIIATFIWWDIQLKRNVSTKIYAILYEAFLSSVSILSRGLIIFHVIPQFLVLYNLRKLWVSFTWMKAFFIILSLLGIIFLSFSIVNSSRNYYFSGVKFQLFADVLSNKENSSPITSNSFTNKKESNVFITFAINRWVGIEGVMAVASYPEKSMSQLFQAFTERSEDGKVTIYQKVCLSKYQFMNASKFRFASVPGVVGFFYYSGSLLVVFFGLLIFTSMILFFETLLSYTLRNPLISSLFGGILANITCQFGVAPSNLLPMFFALGGILFLIYFLQTYSKACIILNE
jgi:hypothetical protein